MLVSILLLCALATACLANDPCHQDFQDCVKSRYGSSLVPIVSAEPCSIAHATCKREAQEKAEEIRASQIDHAVASGLETTIGDLEDRHLWDLACALFENRHSNFGALISYEFLFWYHPVRLQDFPSKLDYLNYLLDIKYAKSMGPDQIMLQAARSVRLVDLYTNLKERPTLNYNVIRVIGDAIVDFSQ